MRASGGRSAAEWVTFALSCAVLAVVIGTIAVQLLTPPTPPEPRVAVAGAPHEEGGQFVVDAVVHNEGTATAANVQVVATLTIDGEAAEADQTIDFLAGDEEHQVAFVFADDPSLGELRVVVASYALP